jgi:hypothetical protein
MQRSPPLDHQRAIGLLATVDMQSVFFTPCPGFSDVFPFNYRTLLTTFLHLLRTLPTRLILSSLLPDNQDKLTLLTTMDRQPDYHNSFPLRYS